MAGKEYIEREKVMDALLHEQYGYLCEDAIRAIPTADVREVHKSKWFDGACVNCGFKPALDYEYATVYDDYDEYRWNYCPNCGAMMEES